MFRMRTPYRWVGRPAAPRACAGLFTGDAGIPAKAGTSHRASALQPVLARPAEESSP